MIVLAVGAEGCTGASVWVTVSGALVGYIDGAPSFVNAAFPPFLEAGTTFLISCA